MRGIIFEKNFFLPSLKERFLFSWTANILGLLVAAYLLPGISFPKNQWWVLVLAALVFALFNLFLKPLFILLAIPTIILTLGLFMLVINGALLYLVSFVVPEFYIASFWSAMGGAFIVSIVNFLIHLVFEDFKIKIR